MSIVRNRYNDPALGEAFSNIASIFAPPSASDMANYATASATKEKSARLAQLFANPNDPNFDRLNIAAGNYAPNQSFYAVDEGNSVVRRGQDISAQTSIANNTADNNRALATNVADNTRATVTSMFSPLNEGQIRPELPAPIAGMFGLPALPQAAGLAKPLSQTEVLGGQTQRLIDAGTIGDDDLKSLIMKGTDGSAKVEQIERLRQNFIATGDINDPTAAYNAAVGLVDGRYEQSRHPVTGELLVIDMATGKPAVFQNAAPMPTGDPIVDAIMAPTKPAFGAPYPAADASFGVGGAAAGAINTVTDTLGLGTAYPDVQSTQADFKVLRERLLSDMEAAYGGRQPPSWLLQEIRNLTPDAGNALEGVDQAKAKLTAIGRQMENQLTLAQQQLQGELSPTRRQEVEAQVGGLQSSAASITQALSSFGGGASAASGGSMQVEDVPPEGVDPADWQYMSDEQKELFR